MSTFYRTLRLWRGVVGPFLGLALFAVPAWAIWKTEENYWPLTVGLEQPETGASTRQFLGPFIEDRKTPEVDWTAVRPFWIDYAYDTPLNRRSHYILYPLYGYRANDAGYYWNLFYLIRGSKYETDGTLDSRTFEVIPFYFDHDYPKAPEFSYWGFLPFYGEVKDRIFQDRISWVLAPFYMEWENNGAITYGTPWPFVRYRTGNGNSGAALWPLFGSFEKPGVYHYSYVLWPLIYYRTKDLNTAEPSTAYGFLPFYAYEDGPGGLVSETFLWPFFGYTDREDPYYREVRYFWPFFVQGRGNVARDRWNLIYANMAEKDPSMTYRYVNRWAPFYTHSIRNGVDKKWWMWPLLKRTSYETKRLDVRTWSFLYVLYWGQTQTALDPEVDFRASRTYAWPFFSHGNNGEGRRQFQLFTPLMPWFKHNEVVRDLYSPLFGIYRYERNSVEGTWRHDLLFNLITLEKKESTGHRFTLGPILDVQSGEEKAGFSVLHGLLGRERKGDDTEWRLFWFPL